MTTCRACDRETAPYGEMLPGRGVIMRCGHEDCRQPIDGSRLPSARSTIPEVPTLQTAASEDNVFSPLANAGPPAPRPPLAPPAPVRVSSPSAVPSTPANTAPRSLEQQLSELRARRDHVKRQLAEMAGLQREEAALDRMLAAADEPPN